MNTSGILGHERQIALLAGMADRNRVPQTMLFAGMEGIGKRLVARRFLASLLCSKPDGPCLACRSCSTIENGTHPEFIELAPNERGIIPIGDDSRPEEGTVRRLIERLSRRSVSGITAVVVDGVDRITEEGQNALLKTIEEPPSSARIVLLASNSSRILPTILSRCLVLKFHAPGEDRVRAFLAGQGVDPATASLAAPFSGGSFSLALLYADEERREGVLSLCRETARYLREGDVYDPPLDKTGKAIGADILLDALINFYRWNLVLIETGGTVPAEFADIALGDRDTLFGLVKILLALKKGLSHNLNFRIGLKGMLYSLHPGGEYTPRTGTPT